MNDITTPLRQRFGDKVKEGELMSKHTNFRIGGPARWYLELREKEDVIDAVQIAREADVPIVVHGGGSNVLYADKGVEALVLVPALRDLWINEGSVTAGAGVLSAFMARKTAEAGLVGLTWMISLPGTIGGAVRGNAGCFGGETKDHLASVELINLQTGDVLTKTVEELKMGYRHSALKEEGNDWLILSATFTLQPGDKEALKLELDETIKKRKDSQPMNAGCAGCIFKNYEVQTEEEMENLKQKLEIPESMVVTKRLSAGWIIDQLDLKGKQIGGAKISEVHGNFLVNEEGATADEIMQLIAFVKTRARNELGIQLQEEIQFIQ